MKNQEEKYFGTGDWTSLWRHFKLTKHWTNIERTYITYIKQHNNNPTSSNIDPTLIQHLTCIEKQWMAYKNVWLVARQHVVHVCSAIHWKLWKRGCSCKVNYRLRKKKIVLLCKRLPLNFFLGWSTKDGLKEIL